MGQIPRLTWWALTWPSSRAWSEHSCENQEPSCAQFPEGTVVSLPHRPFLKKKLKSKSSKWTSNHMHKNWSSNEMALSRQGESVAVRPWFWQCLMSQASESSTVMYGHLATRITRHQREPPRHQVRLSRHHQLATTRSRQHPAAKYFWHYLQKKIPSTSHAFHNLNLYIEWNKTPSIDQQHSRKTKSWHAKITSLIHNQRSQWGEGLFV